MPDYQVDLIKAEFICCYCGKRAPTHFKTKRGLYDRRQFGRCWIANNLFFKHVTKCKEKNENETTAGS
jgi:hypothetical protein